MAALSWEITSCSGVRASKLATFVLGELLDRGAQKHRGLGRAWSAGPQPVTLSASGILDWLGAVIEF